jgi:hypothetical protein
MNKSGYDFRIHRAEIDKEDIKYFKQWNRCRPVLSVWCAKIVGRNPNLVRPEYMLTTFYINSLPYVLHCLTETRSETGCFICSSVASALVLTATCWNNHPSTKIAFESQPATSVYPARDVGKTEHGITSRDVRYNSECWTIIFSGVKERAGSTTDCSQISHIRSYLTREGNMVLAARPQLSIDRK